jgi:signal transduction histidine kinase
VSRAEIEPSGLVALETISMRACEPNSADYRANVSLVALSFATALAVLAFDLAFPLGVAGGVPYAALVLLGLWSPRRDYIFVLAVVATALTCVGYALSPPGGIPWVVFVNRLLALFVIWVTAILGAKRMSAEAELRRAHDDLEFRVAERTAELQQANDSLRLEIAERQRTEAHLHAAKEEADRANHAKSKFLANMSHEFRTPLNAIIGFSEILKDEIFGPLENQRYRGYAGDIHDSGIHLLHVINDVLDIERVEADKLELEETSVKLETILRSCARMMRGRFEQAGLKLRTNIPSDLPELWVDETKIKQIAVNLLSNAAKFTPRGGEVRLGAEVREDGCVEFSVADSGVGMAPEDIPVALTMFERLDHGREIHAEGTGLGLPLAKSIIELHGGTLDIKSAPGHGTRVSVIFPADRRVSVAERPELRAVNG